MSRSRRARSWRSGLRRTRDTSERASCAPRPRFSTLARGPGRREGLASERAGGSTSHLGLGDALSQNGGKTTRVVRRDRLAPTLEDANQAYPPPFRFPEAEPNLCILRIEVGFDQY